MSTATETLHEEGIVVALVPASTGAPARAQIRLQASEHCEGCAAKSLCRPQGEDRRLMDVLDPVGVAVGDRVRVAVPGGQILGLSMLVYGLPLVMLLAGVFLGFKLLPEGNPLRELVSFFLGAGLAAGAFPLARHLVRATPGAGPDAPLAARIVNRLG